MAIPFIAAHVSGVTLHQEDPTSAVPLSYIEALSGSLDSRIDAIEGDAGVTWASLTAGTGFEAFEGEISVSGQTGVSLDVKGYTTISSQAKYAYDEVLASGTEYTEVYDWYNTNSDNIDELLASGNEYTSAYDWFVASAQKLSVVNASGNEYSAAYDWYSASAQSISEILLDIAGSGTEYSKAVASANALREGAFIEVKTGWISVTDGDTVTHGLGVLPTNVTITPSGAIAFGWAVDSLTTTQFDIHLTAAGNRVIGWRVEA